MDEKDDILIIKSDIREIKRAENFLHSFFKRYAIPENYFNRVFLCLSEALLNSIQHGNKQDLRKQVFVKADCTDETITIEIQDEGDGFEFDKVKNPTAYHNIRIESGRGIHIIKSLSDEVEFKSNGKCIHFKIECK